MHIYPYTLKSIAWNPSGFQSQYLSVATLELLWAVVYITKSGEEMGGGTSQKGRDVGTDVKLWSLNKEFDF